MQNEHPGEMIRKRMQLYKMTQQKLAHALDMHQSDICKLINGNARVTPRIAVKLSGALDGTPYYWAELQVRHDVEKTIEEAGE